MSPPKKAGLPTGLGRSAGPRGWLQTTRPFSKPKAAPLHRGSQRERRSYTTPSTHAAIPSSVIALAGVLYSLLERGIVWTGCGWRTGDTIAHHSRWLSSNIPPISVQPLISVPMFKSVYAGESREMWSYGHSRRDYSSSLFSPNLFPQPTVYPNNTLPDSRLRYQGRRPNGVEGTDSRSGPSRRMPSCDDRGNDNVTRLDSPLANGRRRQENTTRQTTRRGLLPRESTSAHTSPWDRDPWGTPKMPIPPLPDARTGKAMTSQDHFGGSASQAGAQIYYAVGSLCQSALHNSQKYPQFSNSLPCSQIKSHHFLQSQHNSHGVETEWDPSAGSYHPPIAVITGPDPPPSAVLPHFAKGSLIELAGGHLKRVEELKTEDFVRSADTLPEFHLSTCTILLISPGPTYGFNHLQVLLTDRNTQVSLAQVCTEKKNTANSSQGQFIKVYFLLVWRPTCNTQIAPCEYHDQVTCCIYL